MTHNPYENCHHVGGNLWSKYEEEIMAAMLSAGATRQEISDKLPGRTLAAVKCRLRYLKTPWAQIAEENRQKKRNRKELRQSSRTTARHHVVSETVNVVVPSHVLEERNRRYLAARSITAILMGDPEPGRARL